MADIKPSTHGIVVEHKENGMRFALSDKNYNPKVHRKVRDLKPGESVRTYQPKASESLESAVGSGEGTGTPGEGDSSPSESSAGLSRTADQPTEG